MGSSQSGEGMDASEMAELVGPPMYVQKPGVHEGERGVQEYCAPGQPGSFYTSRQNSVFMPGQVPVGNRCRSCYQIGGVCCIFLQWPVSTIMFAAVYLTQFFSPCCHCIWGTRFYKMPSQIDYIHVLYVIYHTVLKILCCFSLAPGILVITQLLSTPPLFLFDESKGTPVLLTLEEYIKQKKSSFPAFSGRWRAIDGGGNNATYPFLGQGVRGYAMNEPFQIPSVLPDPEKMSKALQARTIFRESPFGQNAISTWFANVAIHDFFRSATGSDKIDGIDKPWVNLHSGYLDLQVVYGWNKEMAAGTRTFKDGMLKKIAEDRFDGRPVPESKAIITLLMREHNYVAEELKKRYPYEFTTDEALYQQARLIMGGVYINIILRQYGDQMFGENAPNGGIFAELRQNNYGYWPSHFSNNCCFNKQTAGNHLTFNFNLIYRWHTSIPENWNANVPDTTDDDLRKLFLNAYSAPAGGFGPHNMPEVFFRRIVVPAESIKVGRQLGCPRLNDFRRRFTNPYKDFEDMTGDADVAKVLAQFYPSVEDVELAVGVQVEKAMFGGWNLGESVGLAIVSDAFNSIRQDRFYTTDFTPERYTEWGYRHAKETVLVDLLNRHLGMGLDRNMMLSRAPGWKGPPAWCEMRSWPFSGWAFDARGFPIGRDGQPIRPFKSSD